MGQTRTTRRSAVFVIDHVEKRANQEPSLGRYTKRKGNEFKCVSNGMRGRPPPINGSTASHSLRLQVSSLIRCRQPAITRII